MREKSDSQAVFDFNAFNIFMLFYVFMNDENVFYCSLRVNLLTFHIL